MTSCVSDFKKVSKMQGDRLGERKCAWSGFQSSIIRSSTAFRASWLVGS